MKPLVVGGRGGDDKSAPLRQGADVDEQEYDAVFNVALGERETSAGARATDTALNMQIRRYNVPRDRGVIHIGVRRVARRAMFIVERHD